MFAITRAPLAYHASLNALYALAGGCGPLLTSPKGPPIYTSLAEACPNERPPRMAFITFLGCRQRCPPGHACTSSHLVAGVALPRERERERSDFRFCDEWVPVTRRLSRSRLLRMSRRAAESLRAAMGLDSDGHSGAVSSSCDDTWSGRQWQATEGSTDEGGGDGSTEKLQRWSRVTIMRK